MNHVKLHELFDRNLFGDIKLILTDDEHDVEIIAHKNILYCCCPYFEKLFTSEFRENSLSEIKIGVPNAPVCYDIITSFYGHQTNILGLPDWKHKMEKIVCRDFFGLDADTDTIKDLTIPDEGFPLLLKITELVGYDNKRMVKLMYDNVPTDFDSVQFSPKLVDKIIENNFIIIYWDMCHYINVINFATNTLINTIYFPTDSVIDIAILPNHRIVTAGSDGYVRLYDHRKNNSIKQIKTKKIDSICTTSNNKILVNCSRNQIYIWDTISGLVNTKILPMHICTDYLHMTPDGNKFVTMDVYCIKFWDYDTFELLGKIADNSFYKFYIHPNNKVLVSCNRIHCMRVWNLDTYQLVKSFDSEFGEVLSLCMTSDGGKLISGHNDNLIRVWDLVNSSNEPIHILHGHSDDVISICLSPDDTKIISGSNDQSIRVWNILTGKEIESFDARLNMVKDIPADVFVIPNNDNPFVDRLKIFRST